MASRTALIRTPPRGRCRPRPGFQPWVERLEGRWVPATLAVPSQYPDIPSAVTAANNGDTIQVAAGTYSATNLLTNKSLTIESVSGAASTIINCGSNYFITATGGMTLRGLTIQNCTSSIGAVSLQGSGANAVDQCVFVNNNSGFNFSPSSLNISGSGTNTVSNSTFQNNKGLGAIGVNATVNISNCTFTSNTGQFGPGAINANTATATITGCTFTGNTSDSGSSGGAIFWRNGPLTVMNSAFTNNSSTAAGGAIEVAAQGLDTPLTLTQCTFTGNSASRGGAVSTTLSSNHTATVTATNCVFLSNSATTDGAAVYSSSGGVPVAINVINSSFYGNAYTGSGNTGAGAIGGDGNTTLTITNSILYGDQTPSEVSTTNLPGVVTVDHSNVQGGFAGTGNINADPLYVNPGGGDLRLSFGSPAINAGTTGANIPTADFDGNPRLGAPDMGAFEYQGVTHFVISAPATATAGNAFTFTVTAENANNSVVTNYSGTVHFTSSDLTAELPSNVTLTNGTGTFTATLDTAGGQTIAATDTVTPGLTGTSNTVTVAPGAVTHFSVTGPNPVPFNTAFQITVTAQDAFGNTVTGYNGTVTFTSSDPGFFNPGPTQLTNGIAHTNIALKTAGTDTVTATDSTNPALTGTGSFTVFPGPATHFVVSEPPFAAPGVPFTLTVTAYDPYNNVATGYTGTVHFTSTDGAASLPTDATLTNGTGTFTVTYNTDGYQTITAADAANGLSATSNTTYVVGPATQFVFTATPTGSTAGSPFSFTVTAQDAQGFVVLNYAGTVHFTSSDLSAELPSNVTLTNGTGTFAATLNTAGNWTIGAVDTVNASLVGTSGTVAVAPVVTPGAANLATDATGIVINGTGFDPSPANNSVTFNNGAVGTVTAASPTSLTVTFTTHPTTPGSLTAVVTTNSVNSGVAVQVATVVGVPTANPQPVNTVENATNVPITLTGSDPNSPPLPLTYTVTVPPAHGTLSGTAPSLTYTPDAGYFGPDSFQFTASNGTTTSAAATVSITVNFVNHVPSFVAGANQTVGRGTGAQTVAGWATQVSAGSANEPGQTLTFLVSTDNPGLFAVPPAIDPTTGTLTYTPAAHAFGTATVTVRLMDSGGTANGGADTSAAQTFTITVTAHRSGNAAPVDQNEFPEFAVGAGAGGPGTVAVYDGDGSVAYTVSPFANGNGARAVLADVNGDGVPDVIAGTGPGVQAEVVVIDGVTHQVVARFSPFGPTFTGGVLVAGGDFNADGHADVIVSADQGGGPRVVAYDGQTGAKLVDFFGIADPNFRGGARAAVGDVNGDGVTDLIVSAGAGGGPRVAIYDGSSVRAGQRPVELMHDFFAFDPALRDGAFVTAGDLNGDGYADLTFGGGPTGGPRVLAFDGQSLFGAAGVAFVTLTNFFADSSTLRSGVQVVAKAVNGDGKADLITATPTPAGTAVRVILGQDLGSSGGTSSVDLELGQGLSGIFVG